MQDRLFLYCSGCDYSWREDKLAIAHHCRVKPPNGTLVSLTCEPNRSGHQDLVLRLGSQVFRSDTYYYALDKAAGKRENPLPSLRAMLGQWRQVVSSAVDGDVFHLPHDFSDQGSVWIEGTVKGDQIQLRLGTSTTEGWSFYPSSFLSDGVVPAGFERLGDACCEIGRSDLIGDIELSILALPEQF